MILGDLSKIRGTRDNIRYATICAGVRGHDDQDEVTINSEEEGTHRLKSSEIGCSFRKTHG
jgi:hypothetical protein